MGRRKIEIQPITHERNRSVTFLKRKNGLFKKAYELGVLCSVDVAVIIFEERPNGHVKLHQYCSSDVHNIVQRHLHHDGERDTLGPLDFSNNAGATRADDGGDGDKDDDGDDGDDMEIPAVSTRAGVKRNGDGKPRHPLSGSGLDTIDQPRMHLPRNISYHPMQEHEHEHPMSSDRLSLQHHPHPHQAKKPRLDTSLHPHPHSHLPPPYPPHSPAESLSHPHPRSASTGSASGGYTYPPPPPPPPQQQPSQWFESLVHISHRGSQQQHPHHSHTHHQHQHPHHQKGGYPPPPGYLNDPSTLFSTFVPASPASHTHHPHGTPPMPSPLAQPPPSIAPQTEFAIPTPTSRARGEPTTPVGAWPLSGAPPSSSGSSGSPASWGVGRRESAVGGGGKEEGAMGGSGVGGGGGGGEGLSESGD